MELMEDIAQISEAPVIFLSAHGQEQLVARALDEGAADYLVKPFSPLKLAARLRLALRRREMPEPSAPYVLGDLTNEYAERRVRLAGRAVELTDIEYRTLAEPSVNAGRVLTYEHLLRRVWRLEGDADLASHALRDPATAPQAGRRRRGPDLHLHPAPRRLPDAEGGGSGIVDGGGPCVSSTYASWSSPRTTASRTPWMRLGCYLFECHSRTHDAC